VQKTEVHGDLESVGGCGIQKVQGDLESVGGGAKHNNVVEYLDGKGVAAAAAYRDCCGLLGRVLVVSKSCGGR